MLCVPLAALGAVAGMLVASLNNDIYAQIGMVLLIGLAAKNAILIVEFARVKHEQGMDARDAAVTAGNLRFRAIMMTAFAFILGVLPLLLASGAGAAARQSLGTTVFSGNAGRDHRWHARSCPRSMSESRIWSSGCPE